MDNPQLENELKFEGYKIQCLFINALPTRGQSQRQARKFKIFKPDGVYLETTNSMDDARKSIDDDIAKS